MQRSRDNPGSAERRPPVNWTTTILAVHAIIFLTLVGIAVGYPGASEWISAAVHAEFVSAGNPPALATERPAKRMETAKVNQDLPLAPRP